MSSLIVVSVLESLLVLGLVGVLLYLKWREKQRRHADLEQLLDDIKDRQQQRAKKLPRQLSERFGLEPDLAQTQSARWLAAEKQFLQQFIEQQMQQKPLADFYEKLCVLLDDYLISTDPKTPQAAKTRNTRPAPVLSDHDDLLADGDDMISDLPPPANWGDVHE